MDELAKRESGRRKDKKKVELRRNNYADKAERESRKN